MKIKTQMFVLLVTASILSISACGIYTVANNTPILPAVSTEGVLCDFSQKVFNSHPLVKNWSSANWIVLFRFAGLVVYLGNFS